MWFIRMRMPLHAHQRPRDVQGDVMPRFALITATQPQRIGMQYR